MRACWGRDTQMMTMDRNARAKIGAEIRQNKALTGATVRVAQALLFEFMGAAGRAWPSYEALAEAAGVSRRQAIRAVARLVALGYITKTKRWADNRAIKRAGRWVPNQLTNIYCWIKGFAVAAVKSAKTALEPRQESKPEAPAPLADGLAAALARFGNAIADKFALPPQPAAA